MSKYLEKEMAAMGFKEKTASLLKSLQQPPLWDISIGDAVDVGIRKNELNIFLVVEYVQK